MLYNTYEAAINESANVTLAKALKDAAFLTPGGNAVGFWLDEGDILTIPDEETIRFKVRNKKIAGNEVALMDVLVQLNDKWAWVPSWVLRKKPASLNDLTDDCRGNALYMDILRSDNDLERFIKVLGKKLKTHIIEVEQVNPKTDKKYKINVYLFEVIA